MKIDKVTITGADDDIEYNELLTLQEDYPYVEWGILFSESKKGMLRYPSDEHRKKQFIGELNLSAHFCGWHARQVLEECDYRLISELPSQYKRIQLNYNFRSSNKFKLWELAKFAADCGRRIILQYNSNNYPTLDQWIGDANVPSTIHLLHDASGGHGKVIDHVPASIGGYYTGYAGGIDIENIDVICSNIGRAGDFNERVWIDLESGARTNNKFDLKLVRELLEKFSYHYHVNRK